MLFFFIVFSHKKLVREPGQRLWTESEIIHPGKKHAHRGIERDGKDGRDRHGEILGKSKRLEEPAFLVHQRKNGKKGDGDDKKREENRRAYFFESLKPDLVKIALAPSLNPKLQFLVGIFDLDNCSIDQNADGDGNSGQRHDVGVEPHQVHGNE